MYIIQSVNLYLACNNRQDTTEKSVTDSLSSSKSELSLFALAHISQKLRQYMEVFRSP